MPSACSSVTLGREVRAVDRADVVEPEEAAAEDVVAVGVLAVEPPGEVDQQLLEDPLEELAVAAAVDVEDAQRRHHVHRRVDVVEVPLVGRQRAVRVQEPLAEQDEELVLREGRIEVRPGDRVEAEVPGGEPRVLPRVRHREHVERVEVPPVAVAAVPVGLRRRRLAGVAVEPAAHVVRVHLLAPDEPGARLAQDPHRLGRRAGRRERGVELVGVGLAGGDDLVERRPHRSGPATFSGVCRPPAGAAAAAARPCRRRAPSPGSGAPPWCRSRRG